MKMATLEEGYSIGAGNMTGHQPFPPKKLTRLQKEMLEMIEGLHEQGFFENEDSYLTAKKNIYSPEVSAISDEDDAG